jgi:hypothetical protein
MNKKLLGLGFIWALAGFSSVVRAEESTGEAATEAVQAEENSGAVASDDANASTGGGEEKSSVTSAETTDGATVEGQSATAEESSVGEEKPAEKKSKSKNRRKKGRKGRGKRRIGAPIEKCPSPQEQFQNKVYSNFVKKDLCVESAPSEQVSCESSCSQPAPESVEGDK